MRPETKKIYDSCPYEVKLMIALYVAHGWDDLWAYPERPKWLWNRYACYDA